MTNVEMFWQALKAEVSFLTPEITKLISLPKDSLDAESLAKREMAVQAYATRKRLEKELPASDPDFIKNFINTLDICADNESLVFRVRNFLKFQEETAIKPLIEALSNPKPKIRYLALKFLVENTESYPGVSMPIAKMILNETDSENLSNMYNLILTLPVMRIYAGLDFVADFLPTATHLLLDGNYSLEQRSRLALALAAFGEKVYPYSVKLFTHTDPMLQKLGFKTLNSSVLPYDDQLWDVLLSLVKSEDLAIRLDALTVINNVSFFEILDELPSLDPAYFLPSLKLADERLRLQAIEGILRYASKIPNQQLVENVLVTLADPVAEIADTATYAGSNIVKHSPEILDRLLEMLENPATLTTTKIEILKVFYRSCTKEPQVIAKFWEYWESDNFKLKEVAAAGLANTTPEYKPALDFLLENLSKLSNVSLARVLEVLNKERGAIPNAEDILLQILTGGSKVSRKYDFIILNILTDIATSETVSKLEALLAIEEKDFYYTKRRIIEEVAKLKKRFELETEKQSLT